MRVPFELGRVPPRPRPAPTARLPGEGGPHNKMTSPDFLLSLRELYDIYENHETSHMEMHITVVHVHILLTSRPVAPSPAMFCCSVDDVR